MQQRTELAACDAENTEKEMLDEAREEHVN